jgi:hypothetical protein
MLTFVRRAFVMLLVLPVAGCLVSKSPEIGDGLLVSIADLPGSYETTGIDASGKENDTTGIASVESVGKGTYRMTMQTRKKEGGFNKPSTYVLRLMKEGSSSRYVGVLDNGPGSDAYYIVLSREAPGKWLTQLLFVTAGAGDAKVTAAVARQGLTIKIAGSNLPARIDGNVTGEAVLALLSDADFLGGVKRMNFYRLRQGRPETPAGSAPRTPGGSAQPLSANDRAVAGGRAVRKACGDLVCAVTPEGRTIYRLRTAPYWYFADGRMAPRDVFPLE